MRFFPFREGAAAASACLPCPENHSCEGTPASTTKPCPAGQVSSELCRTPARTTFEVIPKFLLLLSELCRPDWIRLLPSPTCCLRPGMPAAETMHEAKQLT